MSPNHSPICKCLAPFLCILFLSYSSYHYRNEILTEKEIEDRRERLEARRKKLRELLVDDERKFHAALEKLSLKNNSSETNTYPEVNNYSLVLGRLTHVSFLLKYYFSGRSS